jgi:hypothetical protein
MGKGLLFLRVFWQSGFVVRSADIAFAGNLFCSGLVCHHASLITGYEINTVLRTR